MLKIEQHVCPPCRNCEFNKMKKNKLISKRIWGIVGVILSFGGAYLGSFTESSGLTMYSIIATTALLTLGIFGIITSFDY